MSYTKWQLRDPQKIQVKAQPAVNGRPLTKAVTQDWIFCGSPFGRDEKASSAALRLL